MATHLNFIRLTKLNQCNNIFPVLHAVWTNSFRSCEVLCAHQWHISSETYSSIFTFSSILLLAFLIETSDQCFFRSLTTASQSCCPEAKCFFLVQLKLSRSSQGFAYRNSHCIGDTLYTICCCNKEKAKWVATVINSTKSIAMKYNFILFISLSRYVWIDALLWLLKHEKLIKNIKLYTENKKLIKQMPVVLSEASYSKVLVQKGNCLL